MDTDGTVLVLIARVEEKIIYEYSIVIVLYTCTHERTVRKKTGGAPMKNEKL